MDKKEHSLQKLPVLFNCYDIKFREGSVILLVNLLVILEGIAIALIHIVD